MSMTPSEEILSAIRYAPGPIGVAAIYEQCKRIENISDVSCRLSQLFAQGKVAREEITTANNRKAYAYSLPKKDAPDAAPATPGAAPAARERKKPGPKPKAKPDLPIPSLGESVNKALAGAADKLAAAAGKPDQIPSLGESLAGAAGRTARREPEQPADDAEVARGLDLVARQQEAERLADSILARLKRELAPIPSALEAAADTAGLHIHVHIARVEVHL